jgi:NAD(P)H dehydrogenase (quinone)
MREFMIGWMRPWRRPNKLHLLVNSMPCAGLHWVTHDDLAAADAALLAGVEVIEGPTPPLTGNEVLNLADIAELAATILRKPISRAFASEEHMVAVARGAGMPEGSIAVMLGYFHAARSGEFEAIDPTLAKILGRPPQSMSSFLKANL